ncbi:putative agmatinase (speB) [Reticulomyxa filosa]|uniref:Putative agmatinase (SpeB) n=1 Tax=Reticulomyxa filosa TaxID=46433 RepID=X6NRD0_RETFI|nr:putative agmatinase (speB) [Reticulomyxa filosa]|eukprot:ETO28284.1 putative agmatinase (speB) [Reticulomyxa filosa]
MQLIKLQKDHEKKKNKVSPTVAELVLYLSYNLHNVNTLETNEVVERGKEKSQRNPNMKSKQVQTMKEYFQRSVNSLLHINTCKSLPSKETITYKNAQSLLQDVSSPSSKQLFEQRIPLIGYQLDKNGSFMAGPKEAPPLIRQAFLSPSGEYYEYTPNQEYITVEKLFVDCGDLHEGMYEYIYIQYAIILHMYTYIYKYVYINIYTKKKKKYTYIYIYIKQTKKNVYTKDACTRENISALSQELMSINLEMNGNSLKKIKPVMSLGGDHSITFPIIQGLKRVKQLQHEKVAVIHFDAHPDMFVCTLCFFVFLSYTLANR